MFYFVSFRAEITASTQNVFNCNIEIVLIFHSSTVIDDKSLAYFQTYLILLTKRTWIFILGIIFPRRVRFVYSFNPLMSFIESRKPDRNSIRKQQTSISLADSHSI